jgi:hypothetical protein
MEATITPTPRRQFLRSAYVATLGAATGALITIGISAWLTHDESSAERAATVPAAAGHNLPATADAAERWLAVDRGGVDGGVLPLSADAAEHWLAVDRGGVDGGVLPLSADAAERWLAVDRGGVDGGVLPLSADAAERWLTWS